MDKNKHCNLKFRLISDHNTQITYWKCASLNWGTQFSLQSQLSGQVSVSHSGSQLSQTGSHRSDPQSESGTHSSHCGEHLGVSHSGEQPEQSGEQRYVPHSSAHPSHLAGHLYVPQSPLPLLHMKNGKIRFDWGWNMMIMIIVKNSFLSNFKSNSGFRIIYQEE